MDIIFPSSVHLIRLFFWLWMPDSYIDTVDLTPYTAYISGRGWVCKHSHQGTHLCYFYICHSSWHVIITCVYGTDPLIFILYLRVSLMSSFLCYLFMKVGDSNVPFCQKGQIWCKVCEGYFINFSVRLNWKYAFNNTVISRFPNIPPLVRTL